MNTEPSSHTTRYGLYAFRLWLVVLVLFLGWLIVTLSGGPPTAERAQAPAPQKSADAAPGPGFILDGLPPWGTAPTPSIAFDAGREYVLSGFGQQGLYQGGGHEPAWTLSRPDPVIAVQLVKRGEDPQVVTEGVRLVWELGPEVQLAQSEKAASPRASRGDMAPAPDGLSFMAALPVTAHQSDGVLNPYPIVSLSALDPGTGAVLAQSAAVLAVSPGFGCAHCHADAAFAILEVHDRHQGTALREMARSGPVDCRSCHDGIAQKDGKTEAGSGPSVSAAVHGWHAPYLSERGADACLSCHIGLGRSDTDNASERPRALFARDLHTARGLACVNCHGFMEDHALALLAAEKAAGNAGAEAAMARISPRAVPDATALAPRLPWAQEPDCAGCHDFTVKPRPDTASGFNKWTANASELFSQRADGMAMLRCPTCHGAPHALYPADSPVGRDRDNLPPMQYQEHARALGAAGNCALCHMRPMEESAHHPLVERARTPIQLPEGVTPTLPQVRFSHQAHAAVTCTVCHHTGREDGKSLRCTSAGCHDGVTPAPSGQSGNDKPDAKFFRTAFHGPKPSCFGCHAEARRKGEAAGPLACKDCHTAPSSRWNKDADRNDGGPHTASGTKHQY